MKKFLSKKISLEIPQEVQMLCDLFDITPDELLKTFMEDLCSMKSNQGSDERRMAKEWFMRGAIGTPGWIQDYEDVEKVLDDFSDMYTSNYPSIDNVDYDRKREIQLINWYTRHAVRKKILLKVKSL